MEGRFLQQTSFTERLRIILFIIAAFFILGIMGLYLSSQGFLTGLQEISRVNQVLNLTNNSLQALQSSREEFEHLAARDGAMRTRTFRESGRLVEMHLKGAIELSESYPEVSAHLRDALESATIFRSSVEKSLSVTRTSDQSEELLVAREFVQDAEEEIRGAQIKLRVLSDKIFRDIFENRFNPLLVASFLSAAFFGFVVVVGFASSRKLRTSLENLNLATDAVSRGDLDYEAPILEADEFGKLTHEFNHMVASLRDKQGRLTAAIEKVTQLQSITSSFSSALLPDEVFDVIVLEVKRAVRADAGAVAILTPDGDEWEIRNIGYNVIPERVPLDFHSPFIEAARTGEPRWFDSVEDLRGKYPEVVSIIDKNNISSSCYLPLTVGDQTYGALNLGYLNPREFTTEDREFFMALTRQCAQAFHRSKLLKEARDAIHVRDEFLSIASHELRTPLTPLKLQLQNMSRQVRKGLIDLPQKDQVLKIVDTSDRQVDRLITLIDDLLDVSRISAGRLTLNFERFNLGEMVSEVISNYSAQLREARSLLTSDIAENIECLADRVRLEQVVINLLTNAIKYAPEKPVHVRLTRTGSSARLEVSDQGPGISPENQKRVFDRFERVRDKNNIGGLGLGLYICRQIIEAHHGEIRVHSEVGAGATFIVEIPIVS